ncbi:hypothetical protein [Leisingera caerulea]|uniref:hypothetical protein n=1 Tax=Leisingera caerulea TaxID=506591 RepID=UPI0021A360BF|nr:hypothetical protein [Leisingera caerulea]UWQ82413.1 hypothetical protein K3726_11980 [Leisingera caerulea]
MKKSLGISRPSQIFDRVCRKIVEELQNLPAANDRANRRVRGNDLVKLSKSVEKLVRESVPLKFKSPPAFASLHKGSTAYSKGKLGPYFSYRITVKRAYEGMCSLGYLEQVKSGVSDGVFGRYLTRYQATQKLMAEFESIPHQALPVAIPPATEDHPIRVRFSSWQVVNGKRVKKLEPQPTPETEEVTRMRENLAVINRALSANWVDLELPDDDLSKIQSEMLEDIELGADPAFNLSKRTLYRVFNDTALSRGGRFYGGWWQSIPSRYRPFIIVNGKPMVEYDYSGLHPAILYAERGLVLPEDPYTGIISPRADTDEGRKEARDVAKKAFNAMINAQQPMTRQPNGMKLSEFGTNWAEVSNAILSKHSVIQNAFYSDAGARLQRIDSDMAEEIMLHFTGRRVAVLPVHDSFLIHSGYESELEAVMQSSFERRFGLTPKLKSSYRPPRPEALAGEDVSQEIEDVLEYLLRGHEQRLGMFFDLKQRRGDLEASHGPQCSS